MSRKRRRERKSTKKEIELISKEEPKVSKVEPQKKKHENKSEDTDKESCFNILCEEKMRSQLDQLLNRKFFVSKSYRDKIVYTTESYKDALNNCPNGFFIFDSEGVKVYPAPQRKTSIHALYSIKKNRNVQDSLGNYRELQEAINNCPIGYSVYDANGYKVY